METIVICSGGFDPVHEGHIEYFKAARLLGDKLVIALNSDQWLIRKKGNPFMNWNSRAEIIQEFRCVDKVIKFDDSDDSARDAIRIATQLYPKCKILFVNGGDRTESNIPEMTEDYVEFVFNVGGATKQNSSSWILDNWKKWILTCQKDRTHRGWGWYEVLDKISNHIKVKQLFVESGKSLSYQKHHYRNEFWIVQEGTADILIDGKHIILDQGDHIIIHNNQWHQIRNKTDKNLIVFEVQFGDYCEEEDIERI